MREPNHSAGWWRSGVAAVLSCVLVSTAWAGPVSVGLRAGSSIPNLHAGDSNPISNGWSSRVAPYFGMFSDFGVNSTLSIQAGLDYAPQGGKRDGLQPVPGDFSGLGVPPGTTIYANYKNTAKLNYLEIPVLAKFRFGTAQRFSIAAGPFVGFLLSATNETSGSSELYMDAQGTTSITPGYPQDFNSSTDVKSDLNSFNWGIQGGLGAAMRTAASSEHLSTRASTTMSTTTTTGTSDICTMRSTA